MTLYDVCFFSKKPAALISIYFVRGVSHEMTIRVFKVLGVIIIAAMLHTVLSLFLLTLS